MQPLNPTIQGALSGLRESDLRAAAERARLATGARRPGRTGRRTARTLRSLADRLDPGLDTDAVKAA
jgi:hypothetical protein